MDLLDIFTNPPCPNDIMLGQDHFACRGVEYLYSTVKSLRFYAGNITHYRNLRYLTTSFQTEFDIYLTTHTKPIRVRPQASTVERFYAEYSGKQQNDIHSTYLKLAEKTFSLRSQRYLHMLDQYGYFVYDNKRFYPAGQVTDGKLTFDLRSEAQSGKLIRAPFKLYVELPKSVLGKIQHRLAQRDVGISWIKERNFVISTEHDADVFSSLLARLYALEL